MTCDVCKYLNWRLADLRISRDKKIERQRLRALHGCVPEPTAGTYEDIEQMRRTLNRHTMEAH